MAAPENSISLAKLQEMSVGDLEGLRDKLQVTDEHYLQVFWAALRDEMMAIPKVKGSMEGRRYLGLDIAHVQKLMPYFIQANVAAVSKRFPHNPSQDPPPLSETKNGVLRRFAEYVTDEVAIGHVKSSAPPTEQTLKIIEGILAIRKLAKES